MQPQPHAVADRDIAVKNATDAVGDKTNQSNSSTNTTWCLLNDMGATPSFPLPDDNDGAPRQASNVKMKPDASALPQDVLGIGASHSHAGAYIGF
jgi:hypothetical protein